MFVVFLKNNKKGKYKTIFLFLLYKEENAI